MPLLSPARVGQTVNQTVPKMDSEKFLVQFHPHLSIVVLDDLKVKEVVLILSTQGGIPTSGLRNLKLVLRAEVISWENQ